MKKTIIYIGGFEFPDKNAAALRVLGNAQVLKTLGYSVVFIDIDRNTKQSVLNTKNEIFGFVRYSMKYTNKRLVSIKDFKEVWNIYKKYVCAVIAYNFPGIALNKLQQFCNCQNIKIIADCTEWYGAQGNNIVKKAIKGLDSYIRMNLVQPKLDGMIAISRYLEEFYKDKLPTICVPPLVDITEAKWRKEEIQPHCKVRIIYAGSPGRDKDKINLIIEALSRLDAEFEFMVIGISTEEYLEYYPQDKPILKKMKEKLCFTGRIPHNQVLHYIKQADFSMFYRNITRVTMAGFPTKFSESVSCGTPVITNSTSNLDEYLHEGINGFWITENIEESLKRIFQQKEQLFLMKKNVDCLLFDYRNYIESIRKWLEKI